MSKVFEEVNYITELSKIITEGDSLNEESFLNLINSINSETGDTDELKVILNGLFYDSLLHSNFPIAEMFLKIDVDVTTSGSICQSPLIKACDNGKIGIVQWLIEHNVDPKADSYKGYSPLHCASFSNSDDIVELLIECGVDVNAQNPKGETALHAACLLLHEKVVKILLNADELDVNLQSTHGETPLHYACASSNMNIDIPIALVEKGANIFLKNDDDESPLDDLTEKAQRKELRETFYKQNPKLERNQFSFYSPLIEEESKEDAKITFTLS